MQSAGCFTMAGEGGRARTVLEVAEAAGSSSEGKDTTGQVYGSIPKAQLLGDQVLRAEEDSSEVSFEPAQDNVAVQKR